MTDPLSFLPCDYAVLIDTQVFVTLQFDFENRNLVYLGQLARMGRVKVLLTTVIVNEIESHIAKQAKEASDRLKAASAHPIVSHHDHTMRAKLSAETLAEEFNLAGLFQFRKFVLESRVEVIPVNTVAVDTVMADYFAGKPPFGTGKKKSEFPDSFTLHAVKAWAASKNIATAIISNDGDHENFAKEHPPLECAKSLVQFLGIFPDPVQAEAISDWIDGKWEEIQNVVGRTVEDEFDFTLTGTDGSVEAVRMTSLEIYNMAVVEITDAFARVTCEANAGVEADIFAINPFDYDSGPAYREAGTVDDSVSVSFDITVTIDKAKSEPFSIGEIVVPFSASSRIHVPDSWRTHRPRWH